MSEPRAERCENCRFWAEYGGLYTRDRVRMGECRVGGPFFGLRDAGGGAAAGRAVGVDVSDVTPLCEVTTW